MLFVPDGIDGTWDVFAVVFKGGLCQQCFGDNWDLGSYFRWDCLTSLMFIWFTRRCLNTLIIESKHAERFAFLSSLLKYKFYVSALIFISLSVYYSRDGPFSPKVTWYIHEEYYCQGRREVDSLFATPKLLFFLFMKKNYVWYYFSSLHDSSLRF